jgi:hypothetical protein
VFGAGDVGPHTGTVEAVAAGYEWNLPGPVTTATGAVLPGEIDAIVFPVLDPPYGDPTIAVAQLTDTTGGEDAVLDQIGLDRDLPRALGETDPYFRVRINTLPDTVSMGAIERAVAAAFLAWGVTATVIETWDIRYQTCWDAPAAPIPANPLYDPNLFCYDDPRAFGWNSPPALAFRNVWLDEREFRAAFVVVIPTIGAVRDYGMAWDDTAMDAADLMTIDLLGGMRAVGAFDIPSALITTELPGAWDGYDLGAATVYKGLYDLLQKIKAAGVYVAFERYTPFVMPAVWTEYAMPIAAFALAYNGSRIVAAGNGIAYSDDLGHTWTNIVSPPAGTWTGATWDGVCFILVGLAGACAISPNGTSWGSFSMPTADTWYSPVSYAGTVVAVSDAGTSAVSTNHGASWTGHNIIVSPTPKVFTRVIHSGSNWVAVGQACATSPDGSTWTPRAIPVLEEDGAYMGLVSDGSNLMAIGAGFIIPFPDPGPPYVAICKCVMSTDNGVTWSIVAYPPPMTPLSMAWNGHQYVSVGIQSASLSVAVAINSPDASLWSAAEVIAHRMQDIIAIGDIFVAVGDQLFAATTSLT